MNKKSVLLLAVLAVFMFLLGAQAATANPVSIILGDTEIVFLPLIIRSKASATEGTIMAGVHAYCSNTGSSITRSFNNVNTEIITISDGGTLGYCTIDFGFDISDRYIIATVTHPDTPLGVTVSAPPWPVDNNTATFFVWHGNSGAAVAGGNIFVIVY